MTDLLIYQTANGGDLLLRGNDLAQVFGYENSPYLAMFGGSDWPLNYLLTNSNSAANTFSSKTEQTLRTTPLTSAGRLKILDAIKSDLAYLSNIDGTTWSADAAIMGPNRLEITITINGKVFNLEWNPDLLFLNYQVA